VTRAWSRRLAFLAANALVLVACQSGGISGGLKGTGVEEFPIPGTQGHIALDFDLRLTKGSLILERVSPSGALIPLARLVGPREVQSTSEPTGQAGVVDPRDDHGRGRDL
jgi:hypothetical protein